MVIYDDAEDVGVVIATFGDRAEWQPFVQRAVASVEAQTLLPGCVTWQHSETLQQARNDGAARTETDWLIFLDADDELEEGYVEAMLNGDGDIRRPSTRGIYPDGTIEDPPSMIPRRELAMANFIVIGAMIRRQDFIDVDGFADYPVLEDWDLWQRMVLAGATVTEVPDAVYRIHVRDGSRNTDHGLHDRVYREIRASHADAWSRWLAWS